MSVLFVIFPIALILGGGFVVAFTWAVRNGQLDDLQTPSIRILFEDDTEAKHESSNSLSEIQPSAVDLTGPDS